MSICDQEGLYVALHVLELDYMDLYSIQRRCVEKF